jgi:hypothetical protein
MESGMRVAPATLTALVNSFLRLNVVILTSMTPPRSSLTKRLKMVVPLPTLRAVWPVAGMNVRLDSPRVKCTSLLIVWGVFSETMSSVGVCCHENRCAEGTLECGREAAAFPLHICRINQRRKAVAAATAVKALRAFSSSVVRRRRMAVCAERRPPQKASRCLTGERTDLLRAPQSDIVRRTSSVSKFGIG